MHLGHRLLPGSDRALFGTHQGAPHHHSGDMSAELDRTVSVSCRVCDRSGTSHGFGTAALSTPVPSTASPASLAKSGVSPTLVSAIAAEAQTLPDILSITAAAAVA